MIGEWLNVAERLAKHATMLVSSAVGLGLWLRKRRVNAIQHQLAAFIYRARRLQFVCHDPDPPGPADGYHAWVAEVTAYLTRKLTADYALRFNDRDRSGAAEPPVMVIGPVRRTIWITLNVQMERLEAFTREISVTE